MATIDAIKEKLSLLEKEVVACSQKLDCSSNALRRSLYADVELLRIELEAINVQDGQPTEHQKIFSEMDSLISKIPLLAVKRPRRWWSLIEQSIRFVGAISTFVIGGSFVSLVILVMRCIDELLGAGPYSYSSEYLKILLVKWFWILAGVDVTIEGLTRESFDSPCTILSFTHASNFDGFLVAGTCPIRMLAFGKKELFLVPFFSWLSLAIGGMPIDRNNRERAIGALKHLSESAKHSRVAIAISPEGTRSTTGQLLPFKKGTFYMWEELRADIVPLVLLGAFELYPAKSWVNMTGKVTVRYLPPIKVTQTMTRSEVSTLLRKRQLETMKSCPDSLGEDISTEYWALSIAANILTIGFTFYVFKTGYWYLTEALHLTTLAIIIGSIVITLLITLFLYVYYVYFINSRSRSKAT